MYLNVRFKFWSLATAYQFKRSVAAYATQTVDVKLIFGVFMTNKTEERIGKVGNGMKRELL